MRSSTTLAALAAALLSGAAAAANPGFGTVIDNLDRTKVTKLHAQEYCRTARGQEVNWAGEVYDVKGGRNGAKIFVAERSRPIYRGYNIVVSTGDSARAADVKKGQRIHFKGRIDSCALKDGGAIIQVEGATLK